ncbi:hypothetical protein CFOL_v3_18698 [Cephalotus follicularis]|uniref:DUF4283 domain-containing protein n=1 Tax=Cephalotus follicularis TaxID=3775 RepID=A0A1Q3C4Q1_CEPFO|nr:hypothetical protein CFOL_v3_18698 [Cephalotus follicularis]
MDSTSADRGMMVFSIICIEFHAANTFPSFLKLVQPNGAQVNIEVEYQWRPATCNLRKVFGHSNSNCPRLPKPNATFQVKEMAEATTVTNGTSSNPIPRRERKEPLVKNPYKNTTPNSSLTVKVPPP